MWVYSSLTVAFLVLMLSSKIFKLLKKWWPFKIASIINQGKNILKLYQNNDSAPMKSTITFHNNKI